jgi:hypothetical protein
MKVEAQALGAGRARPAWRWRRVPDDHGNWHRGSDVSGHQHSTSRLLDRPRASVQYPGTLPDARAILPACAPIRGGWTVHRRGGRRLIAQPAAWVWSRQGDHSSSWARPWRTGAHRPCRRLAGGGTAARALWRRGVCRPGGKGHGLWHQDAEVEQRRRHPRAVDLEALSAWYAARGMPWGLRVPLEISLAVGEPLFVKRCMGLLASSGAGSGLCMFDSTCGVQVHRIRADEHDRFVALEVAAFGDDPATARAWLAPHSAWPGSITGWPSSPVRRSVAPPVCEATS